MTLILLLFMCCMRVSSIGVAVPEKDAQPSTSTGEIAVSDQSLKQDRLIQRLTAESCSTDFSGKQVCKLDISKIDLAPLGRFLTKVVGNAILELIPGGPTFNCSSAESSAVPPGVWLGNCLAQIPGLRSTLTAAYNIVATLMSVGKGDGAGIIGSLVDVAEGKIYQISPDANGITTVTATLSTAFPPEMDSRGQGHGPLPPGKVSAAAQKASGSGPVTIDVLVVWTKEAECQNSGMAGGCQLSDTTQRNMRARLDLAVTETNVAFQSSGVNTRLSLVHAYRDPNYDEKRGFDKALYDLQGTKDGFLDNVHQIRTDVGADVVAMVIHHPESCGLAFVGPSPELMFSVTAWNCATGYFSFGHEIAHNLGCLHDQGTRGECSSKENYYGFRDPNGRFRSIMAYDCVGGQCDKNAGGSCTRVQRFSSPDINWGGAPLGSELHNNVRRINDVSAAVAAYYTHPADMQTKPSSSSGSSSTPPSASADGDAAVDAFGGLPGNSLIEECVDNALWKDAYGDGCEYYAADPQRCTIWGDCCEQDGFTANEACCKTCGTP